ncbi:MAG: flocculation-associated PEP-CTERM protein PepA, partial [Gammaproteobacteria bacterium]
PASPQVNDIYNGIFQTYISNNLYQGSPITSQGNLNDFSGPTGGTPYELTLAGNFTEKVTGTSGSGVNFDLTSGTASIYASSNVNYSFKTDTGFTDGTPILQGKIISGTGSFGSFGFGVTSLTLKVTNYDSGVYSPAVGGANAVITLQGKGAPGAGYTGFLDSVTSVGSTPYQPSNGDVLLSSAGNMALTPVPLPAAIWLFGSGLVGLVGISRRRRR